MSRAPLRCRLFGHKWPRGYASGYVFLKTVPYTCDGIGREHAWLKAECDRCGELYQVARTHVPKIENHGKGH